MRGAFRAPLLAAAILLLGLALTGCVTAKKYRMVKDRAPAVPLDLVATGREAELRLVTVIVYDGPGAWKQRARWDEYVVSLTNRGPVPLSVESAALVDPLGKEQLPGDDPWLLERQSEANWSRYRQVGKVVLGVGAFAGAVEVSAIGYGLAGGVMSGVFFIMPAVLLADIATVGVMNLNNKAKVRAEFDRRRLRLPLTLAPGATAQGSLFFPVVPAPRRLVCKGRTGAVPSELALDLGLLSGLHLKLPEKK